MLSSPRKPPENTLFPSGSLRFTHHVKFISSFWNTCDKKGRSRSPRRPVILYTRQHAQACTGGFTSGRLNSYAGGCPFGGMNHSRKKSTNLLFAEAMSTPPNGNT